jgi:uncharacterized protein (TIGR03790 family)
MGRLPLLVMLAALLGASPVGAQSGNNALVVVNETLPESVRIGESYAQARSVPSAQILRIQTDAAADEVSRKTFEDEIQVPIATWLRKHSAQDRILYVVLTKGIPLRVKGTAGRNGTMASVDSELTLLYRRMAGTDVSLVGPVPNPYFAGDRPAPPRPFDRENFDIYLVTRLDGFTTNDVLGLIDRGAKPSRTGRILLDRKAGYTEAGGDSWLQSAADWLTAHGFGDRTVLEATSRTLTGESDVLGYFSWGSSDPAVTSRHLGLMFVPGAIAASFVSTDARTFKEPPADWNIASWNDRAKFFAGSPQSLSGDLIRDGVTGVAGNVAEPYLDGTVRPDVLFPSYVSGLALGESFYAAMPFLSWQTIVVGDPLCAPFDRKPVQASSIDRGIDAATELPAFFSTRRLQALEAAGVVGDAARLVVRAEARRYTDDREGARKALEEATAIDPRLASAHLQLAEMYEAAKDHDKAVERYRKALDIVPTDVAALNNLAFCLAVHKRQPEQAIGLAERAYTLSRSPLVADTLGWVQHLLGRDREASQLLSQAVAGEPRNAELRLHAAVVYAAVGMLDAAARELAEAVKLQPSLEASEDAMALRAKLKTRTAACPFSP